ncbi:hypothetical protein, partial [Thalassospira sp. UBA1131]|uniref:hypothetical protein n=1 Tax=Thalassospira sp. UBA1131 TaxID=1947672 RepID=UPI0025D9C931
MVQQMRQHIGKHGQAGIQPQILDHRFGCLFFICAVSRWSTLERRHSAVDHIILVRPWLNRIMQHLWLIKCFASSGTKKATSISGGFL